MERVSKVSPEKKIYVSDAVKNPHFKVNDDKEEVRNPHFKTLPDVTLTVGKWDKIKGDAYVIRDSNGASIIHGKYNKKYSNDYYLKKHKDLIKLRTNNLQALEDANIFEGKREKVLKTISKKIYEGKKTRRINTWQIVRSNKFTVGQEFSLQARLTNTNTGEERYITTRAKTYFNENDYLESFREIEYRVGYYKNAEIDDVNIYPIWYRSTQENINRYGIEHLKSVQRINN